MNSSHTVDWPLQDSQLMSQQSTESFVPVDCMELFLVSCFNQSTWQGWWIRAMPIDWISQLYPSQSTGPCSSRLKSEVVLHSWLELPRLVCLNVTSRLDALDSRLYRLSVDCFSPYSRLICNFKGKGNHKSFMVQPKYLDWFNEIEEVLMTPRGDAILLVWIHTPILDETISKSLLEY